MHAFQLGAYIAHELINCRAVGNIALHGYDYCTELTRLGRNFLQSIHLGTSANSQVGAFPGKGQRSIASDIAASACDQNGFTS